MSGLNTAESAWAPLRIGVFRTLWLAVLVSNIGSWMQTVGAQWLLVRQPHASILVSLVQTADTLPDLLFALIGGALADIFDRRLLLLGVQGFLVAVGAALTALTIANQMPPALLLTFTFLLGAGSAFSVPAYQALVPELVPRPQLPSASALGSISINLARAVGPAIAGLLIARIGVGAVFALNTGTFLVYGLVVAAWHPPARTTLAFPEPFVSAVRAGTGYVRHAPVVRRLLLRAALFLVPGTALWALLPLIASERLGQGAGGYGLLLGGLGAGAVLGAFLLPRIRTKLSTNALMVAAGIVYAAVLMALALMRSAIVIMGVLVPAGIAWIAVLSTINAALQLFLPAWVRARGLAIYQMVLFGSQACGAALWGFIAAPLGLVSTFLIAAGVMVVGAATVRVWPYIDTRGMDRSTKVYWPEPQLVFKPEPESGPVVVKTTYTIAPDNEQPFFEAMDRVRRSRLRTGATQWGLFRDGEISHIFIELFVVPSWEEHLRQHEDRLTGTDRQFEEQADSLSHPPPKTSHLIAAHIRD